MIEKILFLARHFVWGLMLVSLSSCVNVGWERSQRDSGSSAGVGAAPRDDRVAANRQAVELPASLLGRKFPSFSDSTAMRSACNQSMQVLEKAFTELARSTDSPNTKYLNRLDQLYLLTDNLHSFAQLYANVHPDNTMRDAATTCEKSASDFFSRINLSPAIYQRLSGIDVSAEDDATRYYHASLLRDFRRSGVDRDAATREQVQRLKQEITVLGQQFGKNIRDDVRQIAIENREGLAGLPNDFIDGLPRDEQGHWIINTDYPNALPFFRYADNGEHRLQLYSLFRDRGYPANESVLHSLIVKRNALASLLGYTNYADYATETAMIGSAENAQSFIDRIAALSASRAERDYTQLLDEFRRSQANATVVGDWQKAYLGNKIKKRLYDIDDKQLRQYFNYDAVRQGLFALVSELFDIQIEPWQTDVWHDEVDTYQVRDGNGAPLGRFYLDMHPREGKYKHAAHFGLRTGKAGQQLPVAALVCNFPGGDKWGNGLMEHRQVETFFHEFGHLLHSILGGHQRWGGLSGIATERDFVEAPSQMLEEWAWHYPTLATFAKSADGEVIPVDLVNKMNRARQFARGIDIRTQIFYAALSLAYYANENPQQIDLTETLIELKKKYSMFAYIPNTHFYASFGHLHGYSARYYTYMWSEVIAADLFGKFERDGMLNKDLARRYRQTVLEPGGSKKAEALVADFLGRDYNYDAFINRLNE